MSTHNLFDIAGKIALVTGASSGIGRRIAVVLGSAGVKVVAVARRQDRLDDVIGEIRKNNGQASGVTFDLENPSELESFYNSVKGVYGSPDIVFNCAGINLREPAEDVTLESWQRTINLNLTVPFFLSRLAVSEMREKGWGRIVNIASLQSRRAFPNSMPYGASKGGVEQLTRAMAEAWSPQGITANAIVPGFFPTELTAPVFDDPNKRDWASSQTAIGRNGRMEDLDGVTLFLASPASDYMTGQLLFLDGGFTAK